MPALRQGLSTLGAPIVSDYLILPFDMIITLCGSIKFNDQMVALKSELEARGHAVEMPVKVPGVDYWAGDNMSRVKAKRELNLIGKHMKKIEHSDAILVANYTKGEFINYVGANTFLELGFAHYAHKKIFFLNPLPDQPYIKDELETFETTILNGNLDLIK